MGGGGGIMQRNGQDRGQGSRLKLSLPPSSGRAATSRDAASSCPAGHRACTLAPPGAALHAQRPCILGPCGPGKPSRLVIGSYEKKWFATSCLLPSLRLSSRLLSLLHSPARRLCAKPGIARVVTAARPTY